MLFQVLTLYLRGLKKNTYMKPKIGISIGDINGIGPEIILKSLLEIDLAVSSPVIIAPKKMLDAYCKLLGLTVSANTCEYFGRS